MILSGSRYRIPDIYVVLVSALCVLPLLLNFLGVDFGNVVEQLSPVKVVEMTQIEEQPGYRDLLTGRYVHTILVSVSVSIAILTLVLALIDYNIRREAGTLILAMAFFCAALLEIFHLLVATRVIITAVNSYYLTSYTWFFCRLFLATIISLGIIFYLLPAPKGKAPSEKRFGNFLVYVALTFFAITVLTIIFLLLSSNVSHTAYPYRNNSRQFEMIPLVVYLFAAFYLLPRYCERLPTVFSKSLLLSMIPAVAAQLYMTFGSLELFDNNFNVSHFLIAGVYFIPFVGLSLNYLEAHRKEKEATDALIKTEKFAMTGRIARTLAHEVRNPLTNINLSAEQLRFNALPSEETGKQYIEIIERNSKRINDLVSEMLNISRPSELKLAPLSINALLNETIAMAQDRIDLKDIRVEKRLPQQIKPMMLDEEKLQTALLNIIINAIEAMEEKKGLLKISVSANETSCEIIVEDNGKGLEPFQLVHIFEPFYTTKSTGTGLGLSSAKSIIDSHGGIINVDSLPGKGTRFIITLGISEPVPA
jgi:signal transduction histidine kinase